MDPVEEDKGLPRAAGVVDDAAAGSVAGAGGEDRRGDRVGNVSPFFLAAESERQGERSDEADADPDAQGGLFFPEGSHEDRQKPMDSSPGRGGRRRELATSWTS